MFQSAISGFHRPAVRGVITPSGRYAGAWMTCLTARVQSPCLAFGHPRSCAPGTSSVRCRRLFVHSLLTVLLAAPVLGVARAQAPAAKPVAQPAVVAEEFVVAVAEPPAELVAAITREEEATVKAFNAGDAAALGALFMEQGELIDENGTLTSGRKGITELFQAFFQKFPQATLQMEITSLRKVGDDLAVEEGVRLITVDDGQTAAQLRYVAVRDKVGDAWPIASYREFADDPLPTPQEMLLPVSWLVGDWIDESPEGRTEVSYRWSEDGNFLVGEYSLASAGAVVSKSAQRIGYDPVEGVLRSWTFDSDGGFSQGEWSAVETGWIVKSEATLPDGTTGSATVEITPVDDDHFTIRSSDRIVGGIEEPDFELKIARRPPAPLGAAPPVGTPASDGKTTVPDGKAAPDTKPVPGVPAAPVPGKPTVQ